MHKDTARSDLRRRRFVKSMAAVGGAGLFAGCSGDDEPPVTPENGGSGNGNGNGNGGNGGETSAGAGGTFVFSTPEDIESFDPRMNTLLWYSNAAHYMFDGLMMVEPDGSGYVPHLAADGLQEVDNTTFSIPLREGVTFHDGTEMTAEDVVYSYEWVLDTDNASPNRANLDFLASVEASGEYEVTFHLDHQYARFEEQLSSMNAAIVPKHIAEERGTEEFGRDPVGTGPFQFSGYDAAAEVRMEAYDDYFLGAPELDEVHYRVIPESEVAFVELATGGIHQTGIPETLLDEAESNDAIQTTQFSGFNYRGMILNCLREPFDDIRVREAMQYLVDYDEMMIGAVDQLGERNSGFMPREVCDAWDFPYDEWHDEYYPEQDHDRAVELLNEAGVGTDFEVDILSLSGESWLGLSVVLQNELEQIGVDASVREVDVGGWLDGLDQGDYDVSIYGWGGGDDPDGYYYYMLRDLANDEGGIPEDSVGHSSAGYIYEAYRGTGGQIEADLERLDELSRSARTVMDRGERRAQYIEAAEIAQSLYPAIPVFSSISSTGFRAEVQGYEPTVFGDQELHNHWQSAWIDE